MGKKGRIRSCLLADLYKKSALTQKSPSLASAALSLARLRDVNFWLRLFALNCVYKVIFQSSFCTYRDLQTFFVEVERGWLLEVFSYVTEMSLDISKTCDIYPPRPAI